MTTRRRSSRPRDAGAVPTRVLFVCMGNVCRSPLAESVFRHKAAARGVADAFEVDSAGTGGPDDGRPPDPRAQRVGARHDVAVDGAARRVRRSDFSRFDHIMCADAENMDDLLRRGAPRDRVRLLLAADPNASCAEVPDPYYGGTDGFEAVYRLVDAACEALLDELLAARAEAARKKPG